MNDLEKLKNTLTELGVEFKEKTAKEETGNEVFTSSYNGSSKWDKCIRLDNGIGYFSFVCDFYFLNGVFQGHGVWE